MPEISRFYGIVIKIFYKKTNMMIKIKKIKTLKNFIIYFEFSDGTKNNIDFKPFIGEDQLTKPLSEPEYFFKVRIYENSRGIYWPNGYDCCPDFLSKFHNKQEIELLT